MCVEAGVAAPLQPGEHGRVHRLDGLGVAGRAGRDALDVRDGAAGEVLAGERRNQRPIKSSKRV